MSDTEPKNLLAALTVVFLLILLLGLAVFLFGDDAIAGPNQFAIAVCATFAAILGRLSGTRWGTMREAVERGVATAVPALFILLAVGALIGSWAMSGTIVAMMYYGLELLNLELFYVSTCIICAVVAMSIGSSWTVVGTLGVGMIGIAEGVQFSPAITAGAVICGAYFGDKTSPLSDATNLAAAVAEAPLFEHIRYTAWTAVPALLLAILGFLVIDLSETGDVSAAEIEEIQTALSATFYVSPWALTPLLVVLVLVVTNQPAFLAIISGALFGGLLASILQPDIVLAYAAAPELPVWLAMVEAVWRTLSDGFTISTGIATLDELLSRGGMASMLETVWLILTAMAFGAILEATGMIQALLHHLIQFARTTGRLFFAVATTCLGVNVLAADQYIAIALPGRVYAPEFKKRGLASKNLSRLIGDSATVTSALVPWNTCGAYMAAALGVGTLHYLPFCFFNIANPIISVMVGVLGVGIARTATAPNGEELKPDSR
ncbi:MAG: Na+/H+ antiporter NhaC family protein [Geminicoccaceae bacterium]